MPSRLLERNPTTSGDRLFHSIPGGVAQTLLLPLSIRALESQRPDALIRDEQAVELCRHLEIASGWMREMRVDEEDRVAVVLRNREIDRWTRAFLARCPRCAVVHMGCGLDGRFQRVDNGEVEWYDLDLPEVIDLRRELIGGERDRYHLISSSVLDPAWMDRFAKLSPLPALFVAEGVLMYLETSQVKRLILALHDRFPGSEIILDAFNPFIVWANNLRYSRTRIGARCHWGLKSGREIEKWGEGIRLVQEWYPFSRPEPRLARARWVRHIPFLARTMAIYHYQLGANHSLGRV